MSTFITPQAKQRIPGLDYLRGLAAFGIMAYHYSSWTFGEQEAGSFLGRVGIYGVGIFYVLSGQTLSYIYGSKLQFVSTDLWKFFKRRFFRIFPLLWLATILSIVLSKHFPNGVDVLLNLTGLFGLVKWDVYFATGAWSIGNELCFYLFFPLLIFLLNRKRFFFFLLTLLTAATCYHFAFNILTPIAILSSQWHIYTNPLNQFIFFLGGVIIGSFINPNALKFGQSLFLGIIALIAFVFIPIHGNAIALVTGANRLFFIVICLLLCCSFFRNAHATPFIDKPLLLLGQSSYSLYLLHPLVYAVVKAFASLAARTIYIPNTWILLISVFVSLVVSYLCYKYFETYFIRISHKVHSPNPAT